MAGPTLIEVDDAVEGAGLVRCLSRHGLVAGLVRVRGAWQVEVRSFGEDPRSFFADLGTALASWSGASRSADVGNVRHTAA
jgi:hypothetical protein